MLLSEILRIKAKSQAQNGRMIDTKLEVFKLDLSGQLKFVCIPVKNYHAHTRCNFKQTQKQT